MYLMLLIISINSCIKNLSFLEGLKEKRLILKTKNERRVLIPIFVEEIYPKGNFIDAITKGKLNSIYAQEYPLHLSLYSYISEKNDQNFNEIKDTLEFFKELKDSISDNTFSDNTFNQYINGYDTKGLTPLHVAILSKDYRVIELIFSEEYGFKFNINIVTKYEKVTPLSLAISLKIDIKEELENLDQDMNSIINKLISFKPKIESLDNDNISECGYAALSGDIKLVKKIIENLNYKISEKEVSPLALAVANNNYDILYYLLDKEDYENWDHSKKLEFVNYTFKNTNLDNLRKSLLKEPKLEEISFDVDSDPTVVVLENEREKREAFLSKVENYIQEYKDKKDIYGKTPLIYSLEFSNEENIKGKDENLDEKIKEAYEKLNYEPSFIFNICKNDNNFELVENLLNRKVNFEIEDTQGTTPLHISIENSANKIATLLINKTNNINKPNLKGRTALHIAVKNEYISIAEELLKRKADINKKDIKGNAPLHYAVLSNNLDMINLLIDNKAIIDIQNNDKIFPKNLTKETAIIRILETAAATSAEKAFKNTIPNQLQDILGNLNQTLITLTQTVNDLKEDQETKDLKVKNVEDYKGIKIFQQEKVDKIRSILKTLLKNLEKTTISELAKKFDEIKDEELEIIRGNEELTKKSIKGMEKYKDYLEVLEDQDMTEDLLKESGIRPEEVEILKGMVKKFDKIVRPLKDVSQPLTNVS